MQLSITSISDLLPKKIYNSFLHGHDPNMPPTLGYFEYQNRRITVHITENVQAGKGTQPYTILTKSAQRELVERFCQAFHDSGWLTPIAKDATYAILIYVIDREDPYRPDTPFALAHFANEHMEKVGAGRAYKTYGAPQPSFGKPPVREMSGPTEDAALYLDEMIVDD